MSPSARTRERERGQILAHWVDLCCCAAQLATSANLGNKSEVSCWRSLPCALIPPQSSLGVPFSPRDGAALGHGMDPHGLGPHGASGIPGQCACSRSEGKPVPPVLCGFDTSNELTYATAAPALSLLLSYTQLHHSDTSPSYWAKSQHRACASYQASTNRPANRLF